MEIFGVLAAVAVLVCFLLLRCCRNEIRKLNGDKEKWPIVGMLPRLLINSSNVYDYTAQILINNGGTSKFKGPWFTNMNFVITSDPKNVHHILSDNFANYPKGPEYRKMFDEPLGDGILNSDSESWREKRRMIQLFMKNSKYRVLVEKTILRKLVRGLFPILDHVSRKEISEIIDMQDVIQRFMYDSICISVLGFDPKCLTIEFPEVTHAKAFDIMGEAVFYRHIVPEFYWKFQKWLQIGEEKKLSRALQTYDQFLYKYISAKREQVLNEKEAADFDLLTAYIRVEMKEHGNSTASNKFLRDTATNLLVAGRDTPAAGLVWFFWLVGKHPLVENKILEEIRAANFLQEKDGKLRVFSAEEVSSLVYLHAAVCETLRLYPPVHTNHKAAIEEDMLPSGHRVRRKMRVLISFYSMGRMEAIWGKDCLEFKPERWISDKGGILHVPPYKFVAFNDGPRSCLGKDVSFIQMKMVASAILWNYHVQVVEDHPVSPGLAVVLSNEKWLERLGSPKDAKLASC
ncbi:hypothetical protein OIU77_015801 [Salix suchowensis]|uniref:Cytochrome P450 n=1 Tax=Salix suchowensis TaxID=1278906 RepID=A0ABQ8ZI60_9ROSI|nr:hypothetical protein OIU77_015801 [Salix suchowensis]